jgi:predicted AAA+ superfamily ATPase
LEVYPFSFTEFTRARGLAVTDAVSVLAERRQISKALDEYLCSGAFPEIAFIEDQAMRKEILIMYARNILYQDIAPRYAVKKALELEQLYFYLTSNVASLYTSKGLSRLVGLNDKTVKEYLSYFADAFLLFTVDLFGYSVKQQIRSPKKVYAVDTGIAAATAFSFSENLGHYLENLVFLTLKRGGKEVYYYKTKNGLEVDFACRDRGQMVELIQVARDLAGEKTRKREVNALLKAMDETGLATGTIVTYEEEEEISVGDKTITVVPAYKYFCLAAASIKLRTSS